jgi:3-hydroxyacyl-[acyl-carrier-protein] dehydratase
MTQVLDHLPHRFPFLFVDRILVREPGVRVLAEKLVTATEPFFAGHFAERPVLPGVLMLEMLAQAGGFLEAETLHGKAIFLAGVQDAKFKAPAHPGDRLELDVKPGGAFGGLSKLHGEIRCEGRVLCTATLIVAQVKA